MWSISTNQDYKTLLVDVKKRIQEAQVKAMVKVNQELLFLYWQIGDLILERQQKANRGDKVIEQLAQDLKKAFPDMTGFSVRNLKYMRQFAATYPDLQIGQAPLAQISWYHNITLLQKCSTDEERLFYAQKSINNGRSRNVMVLQIESNLFERQGKQLSNYSTHLPEVQSDLANQMMKDPYLFDFLGLTEDALEKELEDALVKHITTFLVELGQGFAFMGRQYRIQAGDKEYFIDLLFYHVQLRCYVAVELKIGDFKPEYVGKMGFYLAALDNTLKTDLDAPSIGIILCKGKDKVEAEYALQASNKPIGISDFKLTEALPDDFQSKLPTVEMLENELEEIKTKKED